MAAAQWPALAAPRSGARQPAMRWWNRRGASVPTLAALCAMVCSCADTPAPERIGAVTRPLALASDALSADAAAPLDGGAVKVEGSAGDAGSTSLPAPASCCVPGAAPGCAEAPVAACLCELDPFCCSRRHDALCVREAISSCGLRCEPPLPVSDCCSASSTPGCSSAPVLSCVCEIDPACCQLRFDQSCVNLAAARCGATCGSEGAP